MKDLQKNIKKFYEDDFVHLIPDTHQYFDKNGDEYTSVSKFISQFKESFDAKGISLNIAKGNKEKQKQILKEWNDKKIKSQEWGTKIHEELEEYFLTGKTKNETINKLGDHLMENFFIHHKALYPERILYLKDEKIAGTADLITIRTARRNKPSIVDIYDWKTNVEKGIVFDSVIRKGEPNQRDLQKFFKEPLTHLEECNYTEYIIQLSMYAYMMEVTYGYKIGRLSILFITKNNSCIMYPAPYLRMEVISLLQHHKKINNIIYEEEW